MHDRDPSVETLLHASYRTGSSITHSTAILSIVGPGQQPRALRPDLQSKRLGFVPYIMPGFELAVAAAAIYEQDTSVEGLILDERSSSP